MEEGLEMRWARGKGELHSYILMNTLKGIYQVIHCPAATQEKIEDMLVSKN